MIHMLLWLEMLMQNVQTKQAEEKWSLHQFNFLEGSRKTSTRVSFGRLDTKPSASSYRLPLVVTATVHFLQELTSLRVFLSILLAKSQTLYFPPPALS
jgi:hypothetical protein